MEIFFDIILFSIYLALGALVVLSYTVAKDMEVDFPFTGNNNDEQNYTMMLIWAFWPIAICIWLLLGLIWFIVKVYMAFRFFYNKFFKNNGNS